MNKSMLNKLNEKKWRKAILAASQVPTKLSDSCLSQKLQKRIAKYGYNVEELYLKLYYIFKRSSHQWQDLFEAEESLGLQELISLHHIQSCWLSLIPALE